MPDPIQTNAKHERPVVIEQTLLKIEQVFIYRIPPMRSADGHRAEDWNLANPLATCSLRAIRRDNDLCINIMAERSKAGAPPGATEEYLFAQSVICRVEVATDTMSPAHRIDHWVNPVVDSSRYFALRIRDSKSGREAFIGIGFRERADATNLRFSIEDYISSLRREDKAEVLRKEFEQSLSMGGDDVADLDRTERLPLAKSSLTLKEGEKLHIHIKSNHSPKAKSKVKITGGLLGLKKPPPPPDAAPSLDSPGDQDAEPADDEEWGDFEG